MSEKRHIFVVETDANSALATLKKVRATEGPRLSIKPARLIELRRVDAVEPDMNGSDCDGVAADRPAGPVRSQVDFFGVAEARAAVAAACRLAAIAAAAASRLCPGAAAVIRASKAAFRAATDESAKACAWATRAPRARSR